MRFRLPTLKSALDVYTNSMPTLYQPEPKALSQEPTALLSIIPTVASPKLTWKLIEGLIQRLEVLQRAFVHFRVNFGGVYC